MPQEICRCILCRNSIPVSLELGSTVFSGIYSHVNVHRMVALQLQQTNVPTLGVFLRLRWEGNWGRWEDLLRCCTVYKQGKTNLCHCLNCREGITVLTWELDTGNNHFISPLLCFCFQPSLWSLKTPAYVTLIQDSVCTNWIPSASIKICPSCQTKIKAIKLLKWFIYR